MKKNEEGNTSTELFVVAQIVGCFGTKGYVKIIPYTHSPEHLSELDAVFVGQSEIDATSYEIESIEFHNRAPVIKFSGVEEIEIAERLSGNYIFISRDELSQPPPGSWFIHEIVGCEMFDESGARIGIVKEVWKMPGNDLWEISCNKVSVMFPAVKEFIKQVDVQHRRIIVAPPEGLFDE